MKFRVTRSSVPGIALGRERGAGLGGMDREEQKVWGLKKKKQRVCWPRGLDPLPHSLLECGASPPSQGKFLAAKRKKSWDSSNGF